MPPTCNNDNIYSNQKARIGGGDRKFSKMVELLGPPNRKMVELLGFKFVQKSLFFLNFRGVFGAATDFKL